MRKFWKIKTEKKTKLKKQSKQKSKRSTQGNLKKTQTKLTPNNQKTKSKSWNKIYTESLKKIQKIQKYQIKLNESKT